MRTADWTLPEDLTAGAFARRCVREFLSAPETPRAPQTDALVDSAELVASELAVNAVRYGRPPATLALRRLPDRLRLEVTNAPGSGEPALGTLDGDAPGGRGLVIVSRATTDWGWQRDDLGRITVWAEFSAEVSP
jgi:anti-sigma regulatory factor (Ser/Thr protein kinase)